MGKKGGAHALFAGGFTQYRSPCGVSTFCKAYSSALVLSTPDQLSSARWRMWAGWVGNYFIFGYGTGERGNLDNRQVQVVDAYNASLVRSTASKPSTVNGATGTINNNLILAGGRDSSFNLLSSAERYNSSLSLASISELSEAKECKGATCLLNFLLFAGGVKTISSPFILTQKVDAYDKTLTRASAPDLSVPCNPIPGDMVGIYGLIGENRIINSSGAYISSAELEAYIEE